MKYPGYEQGVVFLSDSCHDYDAKRAVRKRSTGDKSSDGNEVGEYVCNTSLGHINCHDFTPISVYRIVGTNGYPANPFGYPHS
jgi:hypothetical protein